MGRISLSLWRGDGEPYPEQLQLSVPWPCDYSESAGPPFFFLFPPLHIYSGDHLSLSLPPPTVSATRLFMSSGFDRVQLNLQYCLVLSTTAEQNLYFKQLSLPPPTMKHWHLVRVCGIVLKWTINPCDSQTDLYRQHQFILSSFTIQQYDWLG